MTGGRSPTEVRILHPKKPQLQDLSTPKPPCFFCKAKKSHTSSKLYLCYCWFELMKSTIPPKIPASFLDPKISQNENKCFKCYQKCWKHISKMSDLVKCYSLSKLMLVICIRDLKTSLQLRNDYKTISEMNSNWRQLGSKNHRVGYLNEV